MYCRNDSPPCVPAGKVPVSRLPDRNRKRSAGMSHAARNAVPLALLVAVLVGAAACWASDSPHGSRPLTRRRWVLDVFSGWQSMRAAAMTLGIIYVAVDFMQLYRIKNSGVVTRNTSSFLHHCNIVDILEFHTVAKVL